MIKTLKNNSLFFSSFILLFVLFLRVTKGIDLTDEMQYYGEIKGLLDSGSLFSNDLFIQQLVYVPFYPAFYLYHLIFGYDGFILFGRLLLATITFILFYYAYKKFLSFHCDAVIAAFSALSLTFAIPYHNIFALSYNTVSQVLWIVFLLNFFEWKWRNSFFWVAIPVLMAFAHPVSAVMIAVIIFARLMIEGDSRRCIQFVVGGLIGVTLFAGVVLSFSSIQGFSTSLEFSRGFGVGATFFSRWYQIVLLFLCFSSFMLIFIFRRKFSFINGWLVIFILLFIAVIASLSNVLGGAYSPMQVMLWTALCASAYFCCLINQNSKKTDEFNHRLKWLMIGFFLYIGILAITSGNGVSQATGALMVGLPLLLVIGVATHRTKFVYKRVSLHVLCVMLLFALNVVHWLHFPYRDQYLWSMNQQITSVPEFKFISTSTVRMDFIQSMQKELGWLDGQKTLIFSEVPGLYFILDSKIESCMLYTHSIPNKSKLALQQCMNTKEPDYILYVAVKNPSVKTFMNDFSINREFHCQPKTSKEGLKISYSLCKKSI